MKLNLERETTGVATKNLPAYVDAFTFLYNWRHDHKIPDDDIDDADEDYLYLTQKLLLRFGGAGVFTV